MDLTTKCPQCQTIFRASLEQLQLRKGYVRCVHCAFIFDGYEAVVPTSSETDSASPPPSASPSPPASPPPPVPPSPVRRSPARREFTISDLATAPAGDNDLDTPLHTVGRVPEASNDNEPVLSSPDRSPVPLTEEPIRGERPASHRLPDDEAYDAQPRERAVRWLWQILVLAGLAVFLVQLVVVFRVQVAETLPGLRPSLERLCAEIGCRVAYSRQIDHIHIVQSSLKADSSASDQPAQEQEADAAQGSVEDTDDGGPVEGQPLDAAFVLGVTLRNDSSRPQEWPSLTLELTDAAGARIARRHIAAHEYLPESVASEPFPATSERQISLPLTLKGLNVNGFKVQPFFP